MYQIFVYSIQVCFGNISLTSNKMYNTYALVIGPSIECFEFDNQPITATLRFLNIQLPLTSVQQTQTFWSQQNLSFWFTFDSQIYSELTMHQTVDLALTISGQTFVRTVPFITHTNFNGNKCWKDVEFSVDNDQAFNISVTPLQCQISSKVKVYLEYFNQSWIQIPIKSTITTDPQFKGYKNNIYNQAEIKYFNTSSNNDAPNAQRIINFIQYFKSNIQVLLRLKIVETDTSIKIKNTMIVEIKNYSNQLSKQCILVEPRITIQSWYAFATISSPSIVDCFQSDTRSKIFKAILHVYDQNMKIQSISEYSTDMQLMRQRLGIPFYHLDQNEQINEKLNYYYVLMLQSLDYKGQMINSMYYKGVAIKSCYKDMLVEFYDKQVCLKMLLFDNDVCRQQLTTTGIVGLFTGKLDPNISDPTQRQTFFWYNINFKVPESWFGSYNRYCFTDNEDTGQYQGTRVTGSYINRLTLLAKGVQKINITTNFVLNTKTEQYYCSKFSNVILQTKINYISIAFGIVFIIVMIITSCVLKHQIINKFNQNIIIQNYIKQELTNQQFEPVSQISNSSQLEISQSDENQLSIINAVNEEIQQ
ncbi:Conserved_hypothetical protein [Hexamita inflata]|uniref:Transmembrane protein n=1 Tax=Hexamita inflata TaxID=28002 RepID=A0AA86RAC1_9EUKA|nr:Conserved hypothetical protein [Hexamita inflata]